MVEHYYETCRSPNHTQEPRFQLDTSKLPLCATSLIHLSFLALCTHGTFVMELMLIISDCYKAPITNVDECKLMK